MLHLDREQFRAAEFYADHVDALHDPATAGISQPAPGARRAAPGRAPPRARTPDRRAVRPRGAQAARQAPPESAGEPDGRGPHAPRAERDRRLARRQGQARTELEAVTVDETTPAPIVEAYYQHADALYRELDDREALVAVCRKLADSAALSRPTSSSATRAPPCARWSAGSRSPTPTLASPASAPRVTRRTRSWPSRIDLARAVLAIRDAHAPPAVSDALLALYARQTRPDRRGALVADAVQRADDGRRGRRARGAGAARHRRREARDARARRAPSDSTAG